MKKYRMIIMALVITIVSLGFQGGVKASYAQEITATAMVSKINIENKQVSLKTYNIKGNNFVKLRDIAWLLNGSIKQFNIVWDNQKKAINLLSKTPYSDSKSIDEELDINLKGVISKAYLYKDGQGIQMNAYVIGDRSYFKLQDICKLLDIQLDWNQENKLVVINTKGGFADSSKNLTADLNASITSEFKAGAYKNLSLDSFKNDVVSLVNEKRAGAGLDKLNVSSDLDEIAEFRAKDMFDDNYFSHTSPKYGTFGDLADSFGCREMCMGENIAKGQGTAEEVVEDWINSSGHRANILKDTYEDIGIGIVEYQPGEFIWVQIFGGSSR